MRWLLIGSVVIVMYDALTALGSSWFGYEYGAWLPGIVGSVAILGSAAFLAAKTRGTRRAGAATGAGIAVADTLVGWPVSGAIIPGYFPSGAAADVAQAVAMVALLYVALGASLGFLAGILGARRGKALGRASS